jgi:thimet oligopeptidase
MTTFQKTILLLLFVPVNYAIAQEKNDSNPLLVHSNAPVAFNKVSMGYVREAVSRIISESDGYIKKIVTVPEGKQTVANTLMVLDELQYNILDLALKLDMIAETFVDDSIRVTASAESNKVKVYAANISLNEDLYKSLKKFSQSPDSSKLAAPQKKFLKETISGFEKNGMKLSKDERKELEGINLKLIELGSTFDRNIGESKDSVEFTADELKGVQQDQLDSWKRSNGKFMIYVNGPNSIAISEQAEQSATRRIMSTHYNNRAYPVNIKVLDSLLHYRQVFAEKLGFRSFAEYALVDKMAAKPETVWAFQNNLVEKLTPHGTEEIKVLKALKNEMHPEESDSLMSWDNNYYRKKLLDTKYAVNSDEIKQYFEMNNTLKGMFTVYEKLFNISIREVKNIPLWYEKVKSFEIYKEGKKAGTFYLDLYPRQNKYTHFACFVISQYRKADGKEVLPVASLICNFPEGISGAPSLLVHNDVITLFHEFGHLVHIMLSRAEIASQGPFGVKGDFIEAPSQFLENWCWEYPSLKLLAKHYKTGEEMPKSLFDKLKKTQSVNIATYYLRQLYLGLLDFTYEDRYNEMKKLGITETAKNLYAINQLPYPEESHFITSFGHLNNYGANYYGYLWSRVFAQDMFSVFEKNGVMDTKTGIRYRKEILEKGSTVEEMDMLRNFLGREPNSNAFLKSLGIRNN